MLQDLGFVLVWASAQICLTRVDYMEKRVASAAERIALPFLDPVRGSLLCQQSESVYTGLCPSLAGSFASVERPGRPQTNPATMTFTMPPPTPEQLRDIIQGPSEIEWR